MIYSAIARYHFYSGNIGKDTLEELFGSRSVIPSLEIGSHLSILKEKLGIYYSIENLLANHTIYSYYAIFLSKERQLKTLQDVAGDGKGLYTRLGAYVEKMVFIINIDFLTLRHGKKNIEHRAKKLLNKSNHFC